MPKQVTVQFFKPRDDNGRPWDGRFPGHELIHHVEGEVAGGRGTLEQAGNRYLLARGNGATDEVAHLVLYQVQTDNWPYFARQLEVGPIRIPDEEGKEDPDMGIAYASHYSFFTCNCVAKISMQYGPGETRLSNYLSEVCGLDVLFYPVEREDVMDAVEQAGIRNLEVRLDRPQARALQQTARPRSAAALIGQLSEALGGDVTISVKATSRDAQARSELSTRVHNFVRDLRGSAGAQQSLRKARAKVASGDDVAGDAFLDLLHGVVTYQVPVETDAASRRYLDPNDVAAAVELAHTEVSGYLHGDGT